MSGPKGTAELGEVLGDIQFDAKGLTLDPAAWNDWLAAIESVSEKSKQRQKR